MPRMGYEYLAPHGRFTHFCAKLYMCLCPTASAPTTDLWLEWNCRYGAEIGLVTVTEVDWMAPTLESRRGSSSTVDTCAGSTARSSQSLLLRLMMTGELAGRMGD